MYGLAPVSVLIYTTNIVIWTGKSFFIQLEGVLCLIVSWNTAKLALDDCGFLVKKRERVVIKLEQKRQSFIKMRFPKILTKLSQSNITQGKYCKHILIKLCKIILWRFVRMSNSYKRSPYEAFSVELLFSCSCAQIINWVFSWRSSKLTLYFL